MRYVKKKYRLYCFGILLVAIAGGLYVSYNPAICPLFPKCMFLQLTGLQCPGCGSQRAIHQLLHGNLVAAFHYNAFLVLILPWLFLILVARFKNNKRTVQLNRILLHRNVVNAYLLFFFAWWIYRNIF